MARLIGLAALQAADHLRQHDVFQRGEFRQQMVGLVDEADVGAAHPRALGVGQLRGRRAVDIDLAVVGCFQQPAMCSSVDLPAPDGATSATDCPGHSASLAPSRIVSVASPCVYWRSISWR